MNNDQTAEERERAILAAQEIETRLFRLTEMEMQYRAAEARHNREQSGASWKHKDTIGKAYTQETQWFYDHDVVLQWSEGEQRYYRAIPAPENVDEGDTNHE